MFLYPDAAKALRDLATHSSANGLAGRLARDARDDVTPPITSAAIARFRVRRPPRPGGWDDALRTRKMPRRYISGERVD
ncbi:hypothetical protein EVAR_101800_1 [Eumeta japonica]|uniref:Uncharacterized protein n=1 Tax=Eumeta variegata TaxID=151549 RepID=A0A4C1SNE5_EUMVA|nr:hypothetical protein EVAR_101800_1 [Eumeta japonica]